MLYDVLLHNIFFPISTKEYIFFSYKNALMKRVRVEKEKSGKTTVIIRLEYVDANLAVTVVDKVNDNPLSGLTVSLEGPRILLPDLFGEEPKDHRLESVTNDLGVAEFKNVGYAPVNIAVQAKSRG